MTLDDSSGLTVDVICKKNASISTALFDTTVDSHGSIRLNKLPTKKDNEHVCITSHGNIDLKAFEVGSVVKIKGGISEYRGEKQVKLERISLIQTTSEEATAWAENATFHKNILCKPWVVSENHQRRAKRKAEGVEEEREVRQHRRRRRKELAEDREHEARRLGAERNRESHKTRRVSKSKNIEATTSDTVRKARRPNGG
ncbi:MAG: hypothetical protein Q9209_005396 [Squamulea sp. 1 TL-2023]